MLSVAEKLKVSNLKVTPQRIAIYSYLLGTTAHPSADTIYKALEESHPAMSLATVYKTLYTFKNVGLVQELNVGEDSFRYDATADSHPHFLCTHCQGVYDLPFIETVEWVRKDLSEKTGHCIVNEQIYFYGTCKECVETKTYDYRELAN